MKINQPIMQPSDGGAGDGGAGAGDAPSGGGPSTLLGTPPETTTTAAPPTTTPPTSVTPENWKSFLDAEYQEANSIKEAKSINDLAKQLVSAQSLIGRDKVVLPGENATPEELGEFYNKLGRPEEATGYVFDLKNMQLPEGLPEDFALDQEEVEAFRKDAHELGVSKKAAEQLFQRYVGRQANALLSAQQLGDQRFERNVQSLKQKFGDAYDQNVQAANAVLNKIEGGKEFMELMNNTGLGADPAVINALYQFARAFGDDFVTGGGGGASFIKSPAEAKAEIAALQNDKDFMKKYYTADDPNHKAAVSRMEDLFKLASAGMEKYNVD